MNDRRLRDYIITDSTNQNPRVLLIPFPSDEGVKRNGGRPGSSKAPQRILEQLLKLTPHPVHFKRHTKLLSDVVLSTPVSCSGDLETDQKNLGTLTGNALKRNILPVIIGGGHETSYGHFLGYYEANRTVTIVNIDAHTDVRTLKKDKAHSGSPFRQALSHPSKTCNSYNVFGLNPATVSFDHFNYVNQYGKAVFDSDMDHKTIPTFLNSAKDESIMATMDMDAVNQANAPGVSAPNNSGISVEIWLKSAYELGERPAVCSFDLCEVNPNYDTDNQTVKLAALTIWYFLLGLSLRS